MKIQEVAQAVEEGAACQLSGTITDSCEFVYFAELKNPLNLSI